MLKSRLSLGRFSLGRPGSKGSASNEFSWRSSLAAGLIAAGVVAGALATTAQPAEAGWRRAGYPAYAGRGYYGPRAYGPRYGYYNRGYYNRGYYGGWNPGAALAVGAVTGLAIGALAAPQIYYAPPPAPVYVQPNCFWQYYPNGTRAWVCT